MTTGVPEEGGAVASGMNENEEGSAAEVALFSNSEKREVIFAGPDRIRLR